MKGAACTGSAVILLCTAAAGLGGCSDPAPCGPGAAPADGLELAIASGGAALVLGDLRSSANNDCTPDQMSGPTSLTIEARQVRPVQARGLVLCLPRPDHIGSDPIDLDDPEHIQLIDVFGEDAGCVVRLDRSRRPTGAATMTGFCQLGAHPDGYSLSLSGTIPVLKTCPDQDPLATTAAVSGTAAVRAGSL
jgi:hypothetical protein